MKKIVCTVFLCLAVLVVNADIQTRINGGQKATKGEFPYQVSLLAAGQHICGGALISKTHVLTAAHCVAELIQFGQPPVPLSVEVGSIHAGQGKSYDIKRISHHRGFALQSPLLFPDDVAVITLKTPVETSTNVATIALPAANADVPEGSQVIVSGFGGTVARGKNSKVLLKLVTKTASLDKCQSAFPLNKLQPSNICAKKGPGYGVCTGDSGGPMVDSSKSTVIGIVSGGTGRCGSGDPDIYTKVSNYISYIQEEMNHKDGQPSQHKAVDIDGSTPQLPPGFPGQPGAPQFPGYPPGGLPQIPGYPPGGLPQIPGYPPGGLPQIPGYPPGGLPQIPGYPPAGLPGYPPGGLPQIPGYPPGGLSQIPGYPPAGLPGYPGGLMPGYPGGLVPGYPQGGLPSLPQGDQPGLPPNGVPGLPQGAYPQGVYLQIQGVY